MDPLRPFSALIQSLRRAKVDRTNAASRSQPATPSSGEPSAPVAPSQPVQQRLARRLQSLPTWNADRAREVFVECILVAELGEELQRDPAFTGLVQRVSEHLASEPRISARLDDVLRGLATGSTER